MRLTPSGAPLSVPPSTRFALGASVDAAAGAAAAERFDESAPVLEDARAAAEALFAFDAGAAVVLAAEGAADRRALPVDRLDESRIIGLLAVLLLRWRAGMYAVTKLCRRPLV